MNRGAAFEIRLGIQLARAVLRRERVAPRLTPFGHSGAPAMPLMERAYHRERSAMVRDGRIKPPRGESGASQ